MAEKQFKIKVGTLRRALEYVILKESVHSVKKDLEYYVKERSSQQQKIAKMRQDGKDEYDIKKQEEVLVETETMLPDCQSRLREAAKDMESFLEKHRDEVQALEIYQEATALLDAIPALLQ